MTTYAIGDLQGCLSPLKRLLDKLNFDPATDKLWFVGDLVNRGPESLQTLRYVRALGNSAITVLGNHDLHLLAVMQGVRTASSKDTLSDILRAHDREPLRDWLRQCPLLHHDDALNYTLVHAGIHPAWDLTLAQLLADDIHRVLRSDNYTEFLEHMYGNTPVAWSRTHGKRKRRRFTVNVFTRMRYCDRDGNLDFSYNGAPRSAPAELLPWYRVPSKEHAGLRIIFGHWSSHPAVAQPGIVPLDRGCLWGGCLAAFALETGVTTTVECKA